MNGSPGQEGPRTGQSPNFGVRGHDRALELADMSASGKAATCRRSPKRGTTRMGIRPWPPMRFTGCEGAILCMCHL
jgi:hypothetical protein